MLELFRSPRRAIVWFVEASLLSLLCISAAGLTLGWAQALGHENVLRAFVVCAVAQASMYYHGLYGPRPMRRGAFLRALARALLVAAAMLWIVLRFGPDRGSAGQRALVASLGAAALVLPAWRAAWQRIEGSDSFRRATIILGSGPLARACSALIASDEPTGLRLAGVLGRDGENGVPGTTLLGNYQELGRIVAECDIGHVLVACDERRGALPVAALLELKLTGIEIEDGITFYERVSGKVFVPALKPSDILFTDGFHVTRATRLLKRGLDLVAALVGLVLGLPVLAVAALAIKLDSKGPVLYSQIRAGERGRTFRMHKLRSMRTDAEASGAAWAAENDPRVTRVGRFLRRSRIDEIPQLWNVLVGDMSLVGPRPERPIFVEQLEREIPFFRQRLGVKPGVTGHAQVRCRYGASIEDAREKLAYDLFYIKSLSVWFDLSILIDTVKVVLLRIGSR
ncbi:Undecaprenyl-phosphate galactosephosphotransferase [Minicystis rosea]|nr:Undecaprenyl-phosphate galactosephosphotransferase [Minicystis rosea]